jgi:histone H3/H4
LSDREAAETRADGRHVVEKVAAAERPLPVGRHARRKAAAAPKSAKAKEAEAPVPKGTRKKPRYRPGTVALREIRKYQKSTDFLIPGRPFQLVVREVGNLVSRDNGNTDGIRWTSDALAAIQDAAEAYQVTLLSNANLCAVSVCLSLSVLWSPYLRGPGRMFLPVSCAASCAWGLWLPTHTCTQLKE